MNMDQQEMKQRQKLVFYLMDKGLSNEEIAQIMTDVAEAALEDFTNEAMNLFSDEDKKAIEDAQRRNEFEADELVRSLYNQKSGKDAESYLEQLIDSHAARYMQDSELDTTQVNTAQ